MYFLVHHTVQAFSIGLGPTEILLLVIIAIILFAPRKIPELARALKESADIIRKETSEKPSEIDEEDRKKLEKLAEKTESEEKTEKKKKRFF